MSETEKNIPDTFEEEKEILNTFEEDKQDGDKQHSHGTQDETA